MRDCAPAFARVRVYVCLFRRARARVGWCKLYESPGGNQVDGLPPDLHTQAEKSCSRLVARMTRRAEASSSLGVIPGRRDLAGTGLQKIGNSRMQKPMF